MSQLSKEQTRFDARLPKEQKLFFEKAASLGGFRSLTEFVILAVQEKSKQIIEYLHPRGIVKYFLTLLQTPENPQKTLKRL